ncbi:hypothetical protein ACFOWA_00140 [Pedobacter lithocola]|uniref:Phosphatidylinositol glycan, class B n=1 Tax=Pedobacter lithocola TaxID=1908239 RepID=A0ABV8P2V5_9SPHI
MYGKSYLLLGGFQHRLAVHMLNISSKLRYITIQLTILVVYIFAAYKNYGYYNLDEHYQIIGFAEFKLGHTRDVSWEYTKQMRSALQPIICMNLFRFCYYFGINNPFTLTLLLRLISAFTSFIAIRYFVSITKHKFQYEQQIYYQIISYLSWFVPLLSVRFSSETWSGIFILVSIGTISNIQTNKNKWRAVLAGLGLGLAFLFRFQSIIILISVLPWVYVISKRKYAEIWYIILSFTFVAIIGVILDSWFYGQFTLSFYNYLNNNLFLEASKFYGTSPWYFYPLEIFGGVGFFNGIVLIISVLILLINRSTTIFLWCPLLFIIIHSFFPHKELRFIFPVSIFGGIIILKAIQYVNHIFSRNAIHGFMILYIMFNLTFFLIGLSKSTRMGETEIASHIYNNYPNGRVNLITTYDAHPFDLKMNFSEHFYKRKNVKLKVISSFWDQNFKSLMISDEVNLLLITGKEYTGVKSELYLQKCGMELVYSTSPLIDDLYSLADYFYYERAESSDYLLLYRKKH